MRFCLTMPSKVLAFRRQGEGAAHASGDHLDRLDKQVLTAGMDLTATSATSDVLVTRCQLLLTTDPSSLHSVPVRQRRDPMGKVDREEMQADVAATDRQAIQECPATRVTLEISAKLVVLDSPEPQDKQEGLAVFHRAARDWLDLQDGQDLKEAGAMLVHQDRMVSVERLDNLDNRESLEPQDRMELLASRAIRVILETPDLWAHATSVHQPVWRQDTRCAVTTSM